MDYDEKIGYRACTCRICGETSVLYATNGQWSAWKQGKFAQDAFPHMTADQRELLISNTCGKCFDDMMEAWEVE
jgi:hypothetical protein